MKQKKVYIEVPIIVTYELDTFEKLDGDKVKNVTAYPINYECFLGTIKGLNITSFIEEYHSNELLEELT